MKGLVNEKLRTKIIADMPKDLTKLEKAVFIYDRMCHTLDYSIYYYADSEKMKDYFTDPTNISKVDGENENGVVCYTFKEIFFELCHDTGVITDESYEKIKLDTERFSHMFHDDRNIVIDGQAWEFDPLLKILDNCDLTLAKYSTYKYKGCHPIAHNKTPEIQKELKKQLNDALEKVCINSNPQKFAEEYYLIKLENKSYLGLSLKDRVKIFFELATSSSSPSYSILGLNYFLQLKKSLFTNEEICGINRDIAHNVSYTVEKYVGMLFVYDIINKQFKIIFAYNPIGYNNAKGFENFDTLKLFEIDPKTKEVYGISIENLKAKFVSGDYCNKSPNKQENINPNNDNLLMKTGRVACTHIYIGGEPIYGTDSQTPTNIAEVIATYLDGTSITLTPEQYELGGY